MATKKATKKTTKRTTSKRRKPPVEAALAKQMMGGVSVATMRRLVEKEVLRELRYMAENTSFPGLASAIRDSLQKAVYAQLKKPKYAARIRKAAEKILQEKLEELTKERE